MDVEFLLKQHELPIQGIITEDSIAIPDMTFDLGKFINNSLTFESDQHYLKVHFSADMKSMLLRADNLAATFRSANFSYNTSFYPYYGDLSFKLENLCLSIVISHA